MYVQEQPRNEIYVPDNIISTPQTKGLNCDLCSRIIKATHIFKSINTFWGFVSGTLLAGMTQFLSRLFYCETWTGVMLTLAAGLIGGVGGNVVGCDEGSPLANDPFMPDIKEGVVLGVEGAIFGGCLGALLSGMVEIKG